MLFEQAVRSMLDLLESITNTKHFFFSGSFPLFTNWVEMWPHAFFKYKEGDQNYRKMANYTYNGKIISVSKYLRVDNQVPNLITILSLFNSYSAIQP